MSAGTLRPREERRRRGVRHALRAPISELHQADAVGLVTRSPAVASIGKEEAQARGLANALLGRVRSKDIDLESLAIGVAHQNGNGAEMKLGGLDGG